MAYIIHKLQGILSYEGCTNFQFRGNGIGKIGTSGFLLGFFGGNNQHQILVWRSRSIILANFIHIISLIHNRDARELYIALCPTFVCCWWAARLSSLITVHIDTLVFVHGLSLLVPFFRVFLNRCIPAIAAHLRMYVSFVLFCYS